MAARVKADEADAKARRAAVRYLGTVDCHVWPEVKAALVNALRADKNECVRYEAALALGRGCCCAKETLEALSRTVSGSETDGNPSETSERVKAAAADALENCLSKLTPPPLAPPEPAGPPRERATPPRERSTSAKAEQTLMPVYYRQLESVPIGQIADQARAVLAQRKQKRAAPSNTVPIDDHSLYGVLVSARHAARAPQASQPGTAVVSMNTVAPPTAVASVVPASDRIMPAPAPAPVTSTAVSHKIDSPAPAPVMAPAAMPTVAAKEHAWPMATPSQQAWTLAAPKPEPSREAVTPPIASASAVATSPIAGVSAVATSPIASASSVAPEFPAPGATTASLDQILSVLQKSSYVEQREWAADNLVQVDWHENARVVQALVFAAQQDTAPSVRIACIRCLAGMGANTPSVTATCQVLRYDPDNRVRQEAARALTKLHDGTPGGTTDHGIQQIGTSALR
jgi:hypothetical protein